MWYGRVNYHAISPRTFCSLPPRTFCLISTDLNALPPQALCPSPWTFCPAPTGLRADVGKGRACPSRLLDGELLLLVRAECPVQRRRTDAVLLLRSTAALVGPAGPFPPIRPKACRSIALSVRATFAKYLSPYYRKGVSWHGSAITCPWYPRDDDFGGGNTPPRPQVAQRNCFRRETGLPAPILRVTKINLPRRVSRTAGSTQRSSMVYKQCLLPLYVHQTPFPVYRHYIRPLEWHNLMELITLIL